MTEPPVLRLEILGGFRLFVDGHPAPRPLTVRQQQLIGALVLQARDAAVPRQRIAGCLWPDSTDAQALTNLRRELHHLREVAPALYAIIDAASRTLTWRTRGASVDLIAFEAAAERGLAGDRAALLEAAHLYRGDLLPDCTGEWIEPDRERIGQRARKVLSSVIALLEKEQAFAQAIEHGEQLLRLSPLDEHAWCALMRCHARRGERATALHLFQQCAALLKKELGVQPSAVTRTTYREILDLDAEAPVATPPPRAVVYPLIGRAAEWQALLRSWQAAAAGRPGGFIIRGEAGIGKTRLAEELADWCRVKGVNAIAARCYASEGRLAYAPIATWLKSDALQATLTSLDAAWLTDVARLHPEVIANRPEVPRPDGQLESWQRLRFFEALAKAFRNAAPIVLFLDDVQWADADTLEWLQYFLRSAADTPCLLVATLRAEEEGDNPALKRLLAHLEQAGLLAQVALDRLDQSAAAQLADEVIEQTLDPVAQALLFRETEGHPLFIVERGRMALASQTGAAGTEHPRVQSVVAARLALLSDAARSAAEVAAAVGRDFRFDILAHASDLEEDALVRALDELWRRHIVRVHADERWDFSHDRIREVAYSGIGPARRRLIHRRIAQGMELLFANHLDDVSAAIAVHLDRGGQPARAIPFLERAADVATRLSANEEAIRCLSYALALLEKLPAARERDERELALRTSLSVALNSARGYGAAETEDNLDRVLRLSRAEGRPLLPVSWLCVAFTLRFMLGDLKATREVAEQALAGSASEPAARCEAHLAMGGTLTSVGELDAARQHFEAALAEYDERRPRRSALASDLGVFAHAWGSHPIWLLGDERSALAHIEQAVALARRHDHMYSLALAHAYAALLHQMRRDVDLVREHGEATMELCERYGFGYYGDWAQVLVGWVRGCDDPAGGVHLIESAIAGLDAQRAQARRPYFLSLLADTYRRGGDRPRSASILEGAITMAHERGDTWWLPALYLQQAELQAPEDREASLRQALEMASAQRSAALQHRIIHATAAATR